MEHFTISLNVFLNSIIIKLSTSTGKMLEALKKCLNKEKLDDDDEEENHEVCCVDYVITTCESHGSPR